PPQRAAFFSHLDAPPRPTWFSRSTAAASSKRRADTFVWQLLPVIGRTEIDKGKARGEVVSSASNKEIAPHRNRPVRETGITPTCCFASGAVQCCAVGNSYSPS